MAKQSKSSCRLLSLAVFVYLIGFSASANHGTKLSHIHRFLSEEGDGQDGHSEEEGEDLNKTDLTVIVCTILSLTVVTLGFEHLKRHLESKCSEETGLVLDKLFGELTVLGFLAMVIFLIHQSGLLEIISERIALNEHQLGVYVEDVHYAIFSVMVFFVVQVMILIRFARETGKQWCRMDKACRDEEIGSTLEWVPTEKERGSIAALRKSSWITSVVPQLRFDPEAETIRDTVIFRGEEIGSKLEWASTEEERDSIAALRKASWITRFVPQLRFDSQAETIRDTVIFRALRHEFLLDRSDKPPFLPRASGGRLDFDFGRYLTIAQSRILAHVVEVEQEAWMCFAAGTVVFYVLALIVQGNMQILAWAWAGVGWLVYLSTAYFEQHLMGLRRSFVPRKVDYMLYESPPTTMNQDEKDWDFSLMEENGVDALPGWCNVDPEFYAENQRSWIIKKVVGGAPNRQQTQFWMDRHGPHYYLLILQINLVFTGIYVGLLLLAFIPEIIEENSLTVVSGLYILVALLPAMGIMYNKKRLVATLAQVCSIGAYRKLQIVNDVKRQQKTFDIVRTLIVIYRMQCLMSPLRMSCRPNNHLSEESERFELSNSERARVHRTFDAFDTNGSGEISVDELEQLLSQMNISTSPKALQRIVAILDEDSDGTITREEFTNWYAGMIGKELSVDDLARRMFDTFDVHNHGEITLAEFKHRIDIVSMDGLSLDEIGAIVHELDSDRSGTVSFEEFKDFLVRYLPEEMQRSH